MRSLLVIAGQRTWLDLAGAARDPLLALLVALMPLSTLLLAGDRTPAPVLAGLPAVTAGIVAGLLMVVLVARERFDGTLTRLRALPRGIAGYVAGRTATMLVLVLLAVIATFAVAAGVAGMAMPTRLGGWAAVTAGVVLGAAAWAVIGLVAAALLPSANPTGAGSMLAQTVILAVVLTSANFQPVDDLPAPVRAAVQALPAFWSGHLVRQGLLGDAGASGEPGGEWQPVLALAIIVAWIVVGGLLAGSLLRRGVRRGDGRPVAAAQGRPE
jgi:ABC-2 type transport system permease protein